jgi:hypothetical protein
MEIKELEKLNDVKLLFYAAGKVAAAKKALRDAQEKEAILNAKEQELGIPYANGSAFKCWREEVREAENQLQMAANDLINLI